MTVFPTTKLHIASAERIKASFERIVSKDKKLDDDFTRMNAEIQKRYQEKINQLASTRNQRIAGAEKQAQGQQQLLQAILADLSLVEKRIPDKYRKKVRKTKAAVTPKKPDFQSMSEIVERINDTTFKGQVKRIAHYDGYKTMSEMVNAFKEKIESARTFIHDESQQYYADLAQEKANADQEFQSEKDRADKELPVILQQYKQQYENAERTLMSEFEKVLNSPELPRLDRALLPWLESLGAFSEDWTEYIPSESDPAEVMLGAVEIPFQLPAMVSDLVKERMPVAYASGKSITLPLAFSMREPLNMHVIYDPKQKQSVMAGIQSILLKLIRFMPMSSFQLTAIDPNERGTNLGLLQKLPAISASEICKKVYTLKEDIAERLRELEIFVDQTSAMLAGVEDVYTYNASHAFKIPYHFVVINDYPNNFERNAMESLNVLLNNARKCGISFIFTSVAPYKGSITSDVIVEENNHKTSVNYDRSTYDFVFDDVIANCGLYLESVENAYKEGIKVDNRFCRFFDMQRIPAFLDSTQSMRIPFAVDSMKRLISLELGGSQSAHALLSGRTGSGKSTTLHMLITSIIMHYHPDDVELWLVDYKKVEFNEYGKNLPPHLKLLGVERDPEFTFSLLDKIEEEFQRRMELFKSKGVNNITEYKQRYGVRSLPRIIFIVDEFHHMTQAIQNEPRYVVILENILSEYRVFGLSCVFSDQAISVGLRGLTEKGKNQISIRIAMENEIPEIRSTLALANNLYDDSMNHRLMNMTEGDVIFKRFSASNQEMILDLYKTIYITKDERSEVIRQANLRAQGNYVPKDLLIIDGQNRREYEESEVVDFENKQCVDTTRQIPIYMGTPINFAPCFSVFLRKKTDSNILVIGADDEIRASILLHTIYSFKRQPNTSVVVFADPDDEIYRQYKGQLKELLDSHDDLIFDMSFVCEKVDHLSKYMNPDNDRRILICWLGLEEIADYLSVQGERNRVSKDLAGSGSVSTSSLDSLIGDVDALLNAFDGKPSEPLVTTPGVTTTSQIYDARPDIQELFAKGSRYNLFSFVTYSSVKMIRQTKFIRIENFEHKIALSMSMDDSAVYLGRGAYAAGLDKLTAVYDDGSGKIRTFKPYIF